MTVSFGSRVAYSTGTAARAGAKGLGAAASEVVHRAHATGRSYAFHSKLPDVDATLAAQLRGVPRDQAFAAIAASERGAWLARSKAIQNFQGGRFRDTDALLAHADEHGAEYADNPTTQIYVDAIRSQFQRLKRGEPSILAFDYTDGGLLAYDRRTNNLLVLREDGFVRTMFQSTSGRYKFDDQLSKALAEQQRIAS